MLVRKCREFCGIKTCLFSVIFIFLYMISRLTHSFSEVVPEPLTIAEQRKETQSLGYVMACAISQQLESGMYDLHQLADLAESWGFKVGEPKVIGSNYVPAVSQMSRCTFGNIFNISNFNFNLRKDFKIDYDLIIPAQNILSDKLLGSDVAFIYWTKNGDVSREECFREALPTIRNCFKDTPLINRIDTFSKSVVCLRKHEQINFRGLLNEHSILNEISEKNKKKGLRFLVIFSYWTRVKPHHTELLFFDPKFRERNSSNMHMIPHSVEVKMATREFKVALDLKPVFIGIHIRLEKLIIKNKFVSGVSQCIDVLESDIKRARKRHLRSSFVAFTDYKPMGSSTCHEVACDSVAKKLAIDERLRSLGVIVNPSFETSTSPLTQVSGFMANVEQELLSQADFLIMTGAGGYQNGIIGKYMSYHKMTPSSASKRIIRNCHQFGNDAFKLTSN